MIKLEKISNENFHFLKEMLAESVYIEGNSSLEEKQKVAELPQVSKYIDNFGNEQMDTGFIAMVDNSYAGAAWFRLFDSDHRGYGYFDDETPEISIAVSKKFRGKGIGKMLMKALIDEAKILGIKKLSLSVDKRNIPALTLYKKLGFKEVNMVENSWTMVLENI